MSFIRNNYFLSEKIKVFPCAYRNSTYDATARLNTEYNFTHLPHTVDKKSYIIKFNDISENEPKAELICVIQGYYFEIELGTGDYTTLQNKYLNICVASPSSDTYGENFIEGPHLCSWDSSDSVEATLDGKPEGSDYYIFKGLKIGEEALSNGSYQCYALKLDISAKLPISANKIENSAGVPISTSFTTWTLSAATIDATTIISTPSLNVASDKLIANSDNIIANVPVTINSTLDVKTGDTSVLKAESTKVTINKPTYIEGANSNLAVAGTGNFGDKLTVSYDGAITEIENNIIKTSKIAVDEILPSDSEKATASKPIKIVVDNNKTKAVEFYSNNEGTTSIIKADKFDGNATTAESFYSDTTVKLTGDITGESNGSKKGWTVNTTIANFAVTNAKLAGNITNDKLINSSITIGGSSVALGRSTGTSNNNKIAGTLYGTSLKLSEDMSVNSIGNIKVNNTSLKSSSLVKVESSTVKLCDSALVIASDNVTIGSKLTLTPSSGNIISDGEISANTFNATSDRRLKENIIDYKPEKSILDLPIKKFDFIDGPKNQIGCIAQDLKEICPEIVNENEKGYLSIQENKLVYLLLDEVKKLKNELNAIKK